jgi:hypothetical protein
LWGSQSWLMPPFKAASSTCASVSVARAALNWIVFRLCKCFLLRRLREWARRLAKKAASPVTAPISPFFQQIHLPGLSQVHSIAPRARRAALQKLPLMYVRMASLVLVFYGSIGLPREEKEFLWLRLDTLAPGAVTLSIWRCAPSGLGERNQLEPVGASSGREAGQFSL